tara:strand:- start:18 stop:2090 length:2073 start_codon:yes stop_codon:yes gene_type:complete
MSELNTAINKGLIQAGAGFVSLPEEAYNLGGLLDQFIGKNVGTISYGTPKMEGEKGLRLGNLFIGQYSPDYQYQRTDIPFFPSYQEAIEGAKNINAPAFKDMRNYQAGDNIADLPSVLDADLSGLSKVVEKGVEMGTGAGLFTGFKKVPTFLAGGSSATGQALESSGVVSEGNGWKIGLALDIIGNVGFGAIKPNDAQRLKNILIDLEKNGQTEQVKQLLKFAKDNGINITVPEAVSSVTGNKSILQLADNVVATEGGAAVISNFTKNRFPQINEANRKWMNENFSFLNVDDIDPKIITNKFVNSLVEAQDNITKKINEKARNLKAGGWKEFDLSDANIEFTTQYMQNLFKRLTTGDLLDAKIIKDNILNKLQSANRTDLSITNLKKIYDEGKDVTRNLRKEGSNQEAFALDKELNLIKQILDQNEYFARASEFTKRANTVLQGKFDALSIGGQVTKSNQAALDRSMNTIRSVLFDENVTSKNIKNLYTELNKIDATLFPEVSGMLLQKNFMKIATKGDDPNIGFKFYNSMMSPKNVSLTEEIIKGSAIAQGKDPNKVWQGFTQLMNVYKATGSAAKPGSQTASRQEFKENLKRLNIPLENFEVTKPMSFVEGIKNNLYNQRATELANAFVSDDGLESLIKIANASSFDQIVDNNKAILGFLNQENVEGQEELNEQKIINLEQYEKSGVL